jgi:hypothetical protein
VSLGIATTFLPHAQEPDRCGVEAITGKLEFVPSRCPIATFQKEMIGHKKHDPHKSKTPDFSHGVPLS